MGRFRTLALLAATICTCSVGALLCTTGSALAATAFPLDGPQNGATPETVFDSVSNTTFIAWSDVQSPDNGVELCVLPAGATKCEGGGPVLLTVSSAQNPYVTGDNLLGLGGITVLPNGDVVVLGTPVSSSEVAWESPADGSAFLTPGQGLQNGGSFISPVSLFYTPGNVVALSATDVGVLDDYSDYFSDSSFAGPESPAIPSPNSNQGNGGLYPRMALGIDGPEVAAEPAPAPAPAGTELVVGVGDNFGGPNTTLPGCVNSQGTGFGVDAGTVNGQSNAAGTLNGNGIPGYGLLACSAENPTIADGGKDGIGVLENEGDGISGAGSTYTLDYRPFNATATGGSFGGPVQLAKLTGGAGDLDLSDDAGTGVYALWESNGLHADYSADGGATWGPAVVIPDPKVGGYADPVITGISDGDFLLTYTNNLGTGIEDYVENFDYENLLPPVTATVPATATATTTMVTLTISCAVTPCTVTVTITIPAAGAMFRHDGASPEKTKRLTLGTGRYVITKSGKRTLKLSWNKTGKALIRTHTKLRTTLSLSTRTVRGTYKSAHVLTITRRK